MRTSVPIRKCRKAQVQVATLDSGKDKVLPSNCFGQKTTADHPSKKSWFNDKEVTEYRRELLAWYDHNHRVLPWRRTPHSKKANASAAEVLPAAASRGEVVNPAPAELPQQQFAYWVWVSEVMLQQTQVATVIPYFKRWVAKWPTVADLAAADAETVNALWAGLGYYRRARYLLDGARYVVDKLGGEFPTTVSELLRIPGVGPYTSAAVASIAFGSPAAAVDGNVIRVVSRLRALPGDPTKLAATHAAMASELLDSDRPGCYNQALMELGATICRPVNPNCAACPVRGVCRAVAEWDTYLAAGGAADVEDAPCVTKYPGRKVVKEKREQAVAVTVLEVICTRQLPAVGAATAAATPSGKRPSGADAAGTAQTHVQPPPRKRQRTMQDFALAAAVRKQQQQRQEEADAMMEAPVDGDGTSVNVAANHGSQPQKEQQQQERAIAGEGIDLEALVARGARHYLLTMRPQGGLLAGLWEFPGVIVRVGASGGSGGDDADEAEEEQHGPETTAVPPAGSTSAERQRASDVLLRSLLGEGVSLAGPDTSSPAAAGKTPLAPETGAAKGCGAAGDASPPLHTLRVLTHHDMGQYVHVFSHIRQTNYVQRVTAVFNGDLATLERLTAGTAAKAAQAAAAVAAGPAEEQAAAKDVDRCKEPGRPDSDPDEAVVLVVGSEGAEGTPKGGKKNAARTHQGQGRKAAAQDKPKSVMSESEEPGSCHSIMWATRQQIEGSSLGLSSGVLKIFRLAVGGSDGAGRRPRCEGKRR